MSGGEKLVINGATSQYDRWLRALAPDYAKVDGRSFVDLLAFGPRFGALINFYDTKDEIDGDWVEFFICNPSMLLASILAIDRGDIEREFRRLRAEAGERRRFERKVERLAEAFALIHRAALRADLWLRAAQAHQQAAWAQEIRTRILAALERGLADRLRHIEAAAAAARRDDGIGHAIDLAFDTFDPAWGVGEGESDEAFFDGETPEARAGNAWGHLEPAIRDLLYLTGDLQRIARAYFAESLKANDHQPQIALYMAFCRLFEKAQATLNTFSQRYIDFYYRDVLRDRRAPAIGDRVYLTFTLAASEDVFAAPVPAGTLFPAGESADGLEILFAADAGLSVTATAIERLCTLRIDDAPLWFDAQDANDVGRHHRHHHGHHHHHHHHHPPDRHSATQVPALLIASDIVLPGDGASDFATFGQPFPEVTEHEIGPLADTGFVLGTQTLLMAGGTRTVSACFVLSESDASLPLRDRLGQIAEETGLDAVDAFEAVLDGAFDISVTTEEGWTAVAAYTATVTADLSFTLAFTLSPEFPPVRLAEEGDAEAEGFVAAAPALKAALRQTPVAVEGPRRSVLVYPFALLDAVDVAAAGIDVHVDPLPATVLRNTDGEIDPSSPFPFFGGAPEVGCYFEIRESELFVKSIYEITVRVDWFELPQDAQGFAGYYRFYTVGADGLPLIPPIDNLSFKVELSVRNPGWWRLKAPGSERAHIDDFVYRTREDGANGESICTGTPPVPDGPLCPYTAFDGLDIDRKGVGPHYDPAKSAFRIQLSAPSYGYGSSIYAPNVLKAVIADLPNSGLCQAKCEAACEIWNTLQTGIQTGLDECAGLTGDDYFICATGKLAAVIVRLIAAYEGCKRNCPPPPASAAEDEATGALRDLLASLPSVLDPTLRETLPRLRRGLDANVSPCQQACRNFLRIALDVAGCLVETAILAPEIPPEIELPKALQPVLDAMAQYYTQCLDTCIALCMQPKSNLKYPSDPYLPQAQSISVTYRADVTAPAAPGRPSDLTFFHLTPFGGYAQRVLDGTAVPLLPRYAEPGNLYLGLSHYLRAQELTLLFQMANPRPGGVADELPPVSWACLSRNDWTALSPAQILSDGTNGLQNTGILALRLPAAAGTGTIMPPAQRWLRASVARDCEGFPRTVAVTPQALLARRVQEGEGRAPYREPIPAGTITSAVQDLGDVSGVTQPMPSFGGRAAQDERDFKIASGERLRHKDRAVLSWDYERLVLERFPSIWKVKALPAHDAIQSRVPGATLVVVVPGPEFPQVADPTVPAAPGDVLGEIETYLAARASPFAAIRVDNPLYRRIKVEATVVFASGENPGDAVGRLNDELVQYLSPWFYDAARAGARYWEEAEISAFIQSRPYVALLTSLKLTPDPVGEAEPADWCFVTSARAHDIVDAGWQGGRR